MYKLIREKPFSHILTAAVILFMLIGTWQAWGSHGEMARWAPINATVQLEGATIIVSNISLTNYGYPRIPIRAPFSHMIEALPAKVENIVRRVVYFYGSSPVIPERSQVIISAEIRYSAPEEKPNLSFHLEGCQDSRSGYILNGNNFKMGEILVGHIPWVQEEFVLLITDNKTGITESLTLHPSLWKLLSYQIGDPGPPRIPINNPEEIVLTDFLEPIKLYLSDGEMSYRWTDYVVPEMKGNFPWRLLVVTRKGKPVIPRTDECTWEGPRFGFQNVYFYKLLYYEESGKTPFACQKLYFTRWRDTWKVLNVDPDEPYSPNN